MRPARSGAPRWLPPALLLPLLLCCPLAARGDCGLPPDMPGATAQLEGRTAFPAGARVGYYCNEGFAKIIGKVNVVHCLPGGEWTRLEVFCQRSCGITPSVLYGHKKDIYIPVSSHPAGFVVEYECNPGYARNHSVSANITCLQNYTWSKPEIFCYKRSCPDPGKIENGHIRIPTDILFTSYIYFSCDPGYKLVGKSSTSCYYEGNDMIWDDPFPKCQEIPTTPQTPTTMDAQGTKAPSAPPKPTTVNVPAPKSPPTPPHLTTANVPDTEGTPALQNLTTRSSSTTKALLIPQNPTSPVLAMDAPPPSQKPVTASDSATTANTSPLSKALSTEPQLAVQTLLLTDSPATRATPEPQSLTTAKASHAQSLPETQTFSTVHVPVTEGPQTTQRLTSAHIAATQNQTVFTPPSTSRGSGLLTAVVTITASGLTVGAVIIFIIIINKKFGRSSSYYLHENSKALNVMFHDFTETDASEVCPGK
ncbi:complement decay-accelerating factor isoform X2 [Pipistrellus kuhlii]|uniref:complement decay-accelerating factor isoform X2 n=1 Tax=Pipistrellus kuhlii TaxID=59472 RepID=UPI001E270FA4|nr:complement decay-accelerating factor isoform X2 [Pipistrellus kuhlii]